MNTDRQSIFQTLLAVAVVGIVLALVKLSAEIIAPVLFAFFLAALARPAFVYLERRGWGRGWALLGVMVMLLILGGLMLLLAWLYIDRLSTGLSEYSEQLLSRFGITEQTEASVEQSLQINLTASLSGTFSSALIAIVTALAKVIGGVIFSFVLAIMLLIEWPRFAQVVKGVGNNQPFVSKVPIVANTAVAYFAVRAKINLITGVVFGIALFVAGIDYAPLWAVVTFFLSFIPYLGIFLAATAPALLGLAEHGWWAFWYVIVMVTIINLGVEYVVAPTMTGRRLSLSPTVVFVMFFFWTYLLGSIGMLISMPITVLVMLVFASEESTAWIARMLGSTGDDELVDAPSATAALAANTDSTDIEP